MRLSIIQNGDSVLRKQPKELGRELVETSKALLSSDVRFTPKRVVFLLKEWSQRHPGQVKRVNPKHLLPLESHLSFHPSHIPIRRARLRRQGNPQSVGDSNQTAPIVVVGEGVVGSILRLEDPRDPRGRVERVRTQTPTPVERVDIEARKRRTHSAGVQNIGVELSGVGSTEPHFKHGVVGQDSPLSRNNQRLRASRPVIVGNESPVFCLHKTFKRLKLVRKKTKAAVGALSIVHCIVHLLERASVTSPNVLNNLEELSASHTFIGGEVDYGEPMLLNNAWRCTKSVQVLDRVAHPWLNSETTAHEKK